MEERGAGPAELQENNPIPVSSRCECPDPSAPTSEQWELTRGPCTPLP